MEKAPILHADNIHKTFYHPTEVTILKGLQLEVFPGEAVAIMGRSGEGKSTLLHILGTLEKASQGSLVISGKPVSHYSLSYLRNHHFGFIFQSFHLMEDFTVLENVLMPAKIAREPTHPGSSMRKRGEQLLELVGLSERAHFATKLLSGGEKQRVAIARAFCNQPDIILADEPSGNLDHRTAGEIHQLLINFCKREERALIVVTHNQELANLCDRCYFLKDGVLV